MATTKPKTEEMVKCPECKGSGRGWEDSGSMSAPDVWGTCWVCRGAKVIPKRLTKLVRCTCCGGGGKENVLRKNWQDMQR